MPLDLKGFVGEPNQWAGLYHAADQMEKRKLRADQLALQQQTKRNATGTFLQNYLDPKDYLSGTQFDPMIIQGLQEAMKQGTLLAASGADSPSLLMALGPMVNKLITYSTNAKTINKQVDDQISRMKESGYMGYDYAKLKEEALQNAFYKQDANGQMQLNPDQADTSVNWVDKAIELSPEKVTTSRGWDTFADKAKMKENTLSVQDFDRFGTLDRNDVNVKFQEYMVPEWETYKGGRRIKGFVPDFEVAQDGGQPIRHSFTDAAGKSAFEPVRVVKQSIYDGLSKDLKDNIRGQVKAHINEYETATGEKLLPNSPKVNIIERAIAYNELNRPQRNFGNIGQKIIDNKPSQQMISLNVKSTPQYRETERNLLEDRANIRDQHRLLKTNPIETVGEIFNGNPDYLQGERVLVPGGDGTKMYDVTGVFPGGGLKSGRGQGYSYRNIYFDPDARALTVVREAKQDMFGRKLTTNETIPEKDIGKFIYKIGEANGVPYSKIKEYLKKIGYSNNEFKSTRQTQDQRDFERHQQGANGWRRSMLPGQPFNSLTPSTQRTNP
jgi:hypothetical protein